VFCTAIRRASSATAARLWAARGGVRKSANQSRLGVAQLVAMSERKFREQSFGAWHKAKLYLAPVGAAARAPDPTANFQAAAQLDCAVVADLHPLG